MATKIICEFTNNLYGDEIKYFNIEQFFKEEPKEVLKLLNNKYLFSGYKGININYYTYHNSGKSYRLLLEEFNNPEIKVINPLEKTNFSFLKESKINEEKLNHLIRLFYEKYFVYDKHSFGPTYILKNKGPITNSNYENHNYFKTRIKESNNEKEKNLADF